MKKARSESRKAKPSIPKDFSSSIDQAVDCCVKIETFAELLKNCENAEGLNPMAIAHTGSSLLDEIEKLRDVLRKIHLHLPSNRN